MATTAKKSASPVAPVKTSAVKKSAPVKAVKAKPVAAKKLTAPDMHLKPSTAPNPALSTEQRNHFVAVAAFYIAERRGFTLGNPQDDWLAAEAEIDRLIASGHFSF